MLNNTDYIELCEAIGDEILSLPVFQMYKKLQHEMNHNQEIIQLINEFEKAKELYADVERYGGKYHPDYKEVSQRLIDTKSNLYQNASVKEFKACEKEIQSILDEISNYISQAVEVTVKTKTKSCGCGSGNCSR
ncbi:YlbF family regulator [Turicibacter sp. TJ11]|uniref:YlbF family regulator n=1 Tax=Turicibacter sp. TJ11 TaxID=2806443 RepID=UPI001F2C91CA|nr:YlbF family regulator [Turicibacter sp. TJ11]